MSKNTVSIVIFLILMVTHVALFLFNITDLNNSIERISSDSIEKTLNKIANDFNLYKDKNIHFKIIEIQKDSKGQITSMNYNMDEVYQIARKMEEHLSNRFLKEEQISLKPYQLTNRISHQHQGILLLIPLGMITQNPLINNLGPKIPVVIHFMDTFLAQVQTKVTNYGINNALMEIILHIKIKYEIIGFKKSVKKEIEYNYLIDSRIIQGSVPNWYAGTYEKHSAFYEFPKSEGIENLQPKE